MRGLDALSPVPLLDAADIQAAKKYLGGGGAALRCGDIPASTHLIDAILQRSQTDSEQSRGILAVLIHVLQGQINECRLHLR